MITNMNKFLEQAKVFNQNIGNYETVHIVLGNESCDLDSAVSSLVYAYFLFKTEATSAKNNCVIPVLNIQHDEFPLRTETRYFLRKNGINTDNLIFRNQIDLSALSTSGKLNLTLVDHHVLPAQDQHLAKSVVEVMDHRPTDPSVNWPLARVTIDTVGSCATLVANKIVTQQCSNVLDDTVARLLHGTIVLDTINFSPSAQRYKKLDQQMVASLQKADHIDYTAEKLFAELVSARSDVSTLSPFQILHRDMKIINDMPYPAVPMLVAEFLDLPGAVEALTQFCQARRCKVTVPMGLKSQGDAVFRDIAVFSVTVCELTSALIDCLKGNETLQLREIDRQVPGLRLFAQGNVQASRKHIVPMLNGVLGQYRGLNVL